MRGSIRRRDSRRAADGPQRWELRVYLGRDKNGQNKRGAPTNEAFEVRASTGTNYRGNVRVVLANRAYDGTA
jgi:hypothetical protein